MGEPGCRSAGAYACKMTAPPRGHAGDVANVVTGAEIRDVHHGAGGTVRRGRRLPDRGHHRSRRPRRVHGNAVLPGLSCRTNADARSAGQPGITDRGLLATVRAPGPGGAGTWKTAWAQLAPSRQAAVITAYGRPPTDECGRPLPAPRTLPGRPNADRNSDHGGRNAR